jgi:hypothetical protein
MVSLSLSFGNAPASTVGYAIHGMVLCAFLGEVETGYGFGQLALSLLGSVQCARIQVYNSACVWGLYSASSRSSLGNDTDAERWLYGWHGNWRFSRRWLQHNIYFNTNFSVG